MDFTSSLGGGVSGDDPDDGAGSGVPRLRREPQRGEVRDPAHGAYRLTRAGRGPAPVPLPEAAARVPGRKPPRRSAERASRLQRDGPRFAHAVVAPRTRDTREKSAPVGAPPPPLWGQTWKRKARRGTPRGAAGWSTAGRDNEPRARNPSGVFPCAAGWTGAGHTKAVPARIDSALTHSLASPAGLTRGSILFARRFCEEDGGLPGQARQ